MASRPRHAPINDRRVPWNLVLIRVVTAVGLLTAVSCVGFMVNESLTSYAAGSARSAGCGGDAGWFSSMGLSFFGGFAAVITGGAYGIRRRNRASGVWHSLTGLGPSAAR